MIGDFLYRVGDKPPDKFAYDRGRRRFWVEVARRNPATIHAIMLVKSISEKPLYRLVISHMRNLHKWPYEPTPAMKRDLIIAVFGVKKWPAE